MQVRLLADLLYIYKDDKIRIRNVLADDKYILVILQFFFHKFEVQNKYKHSLSYFEMCE